MDRNEEMKREKAGARKRTRKNERMKESISTVSERISMSRLCASSLSVTSLLAS